MSWFVKWAQDLHLQYVCCHDDKRKRLDLVQICIPIFIFTRIRHMERRSHCTEVAKNVFTGTRKLSPTFQSLFSKCVLTGLKWQNGSVLFLQSLGGGNKSVSRVKGGKSAIFKEEVGRLCSPDFFYLFLISELSADFLSSVQGGQWKEAA